MAGLSNQEEVHVSNHLGKTLIAHCRSKDDDFGAQLFIVESELSWSFSDYFGVALFWCNLAVSDKRLHFDAYKNDGVPYPTNWAVNDDGVYSTDTGFTLYPWNTI
ncbi:S-protein homolog 2 [Linum grandiflorum]